MSIENSTSFMLAPGETDVCGTKVSPSLLTPYLHGELMCSSTRFVYKVPNTLLGFIPMGANENTIPLKSIASVNASTKVLVGRLLLGLTLILAGLAMLGELSGTSLLFMLFGAIFLAVSFPCQLNIVNHAGGVTSITVSVLEKTKLEQFKQELQGRVFADLSVTQHQESMQLQQMQTMLQQMQLQQMQQNQNKNDNN